MSDTILITGGTGFAGSHLVEYLLSQGQTNLHVTTSSGRPSFVHGLLPAEHIHQVDLTDQSATFELIQRLVPTQVYHLAALSTVGGSFDTAERIIVDNTRLQMNVLEAIRQFQPAARNLIIGSAMEYDLLQYPTELIDELHPLGPANPYGVSKVNQDLLGLSYVYAYKLDVVRARPFNHIGERQTPDFAIAAFADQIKNLRQSGQGEIKVGNLEAIRDLSDVKDIVRAYVTLMEQGKTGEVYNIGSGQGYRMQAVLETMIELAGVQVDVVTDPTRFRPIDIPKIIADTSKIKQLGWQSEIAIEDTLKRILA